MFKLPRSLTLFPRRKRNKGSNYDDDDDDTSPVDKIDNAMGTVHFHGQTFLCVSDSEK